MAKWKDANPSQGIPERMERYEYVEFDDLKREDQFLIKDYEVFESKKDTYDEESKWGVHIAVEITSGETVRVCTHAKAIVSTFRDGDPDIIKELIADKTPCKIEMQKTKDGKYKYPVLV